MTCAERDAIIFNLLTENKVNIQTLVTKVSEMAVTVADHSTRLETLEKGSCRHDQEIRDLKQLHRAAPLAELKINGIPLPCTVPPLDLSHSLLDFLDLQLLKNEIKAVRIHEMREVASASTQAPSNVRENRVASETKSLVIRFKARDPVLQVLDKKKEHGKIVVSDIVPNGPTTELTVFEMLPYYIYRLRKKARECGNKHGYKHVWVSDGTVLVGKNDSSKILQIMTESDLANIK